MRSLVRWLLICCALGAALGLAGADEPQPILVVFRCDDYRAADPEGKYDSEWPAMQGIIEIFRRHRLKLDVAIIPFSVSSNDLNSEKRPLPSSPERLEFLLQAIKDGTVEPTLHGYAHRDLGRWGVAGEFAGMGADEQLQMIREGKQMLEGCLGQPMNTFVPPYFQYDAATTDALVKLGIPIISSRIHHIPYNPDLAYVPATARFVEMPEALAAAETHNDLCLIVFCFHPFEIQEAGVIPDGISLAELEQLVVKIADNPRVQVVTLSEVAARWPQFTTARYAHLHCSLHSVWITPYLKRITAFATSHRSGRVLWPAYVYHRLYFVLLLPAAAGLVLGLLIGTLIFRPSRHSYLRRLGNCLVWAGVVLGVAWVVSGIAHAWVGDLFRPKMQAIIWTALGLMLASARLRRPQSTTRKSP